MTDLPGAYIQRLLESPLSNLCSLNHEPAGHTYLPSRFSSIHFISWPLSAVSASLGYIDQFANNRPLPT